MKNPRLHRKILPVLMGFLLLLAAVGRAENVSLSAEVDKSEIRFGESLNLYVTITQELTGYSGQRLSAPNVEQIPDFDIVSRRTSQNMNFVNGAGQVQIQTVLELVPQGPGHKTIPGFSFSLPGGKTVSSKPISVKVLEPAKEAEGAAETPEDTAGAEEEERGGINFFKGLLIVGLVVLLIIAFPILLSWILTRNVKPSTRWNAAKQTPTRTIAPDADEEIAEFRPAPMGPEDRESDRQTGRGDSENPPVSPGSRPAPEAVNFLAEVNALKRLHPDTDLEFYRAYFDVFHRALIGGSRQLRDHMTPDELVKVLLGLLPHAQHETLKRVGNDWEAVVFARSKPARLFQQVHEEALHILSTLQSQERTP